MSRTDLLIILERKIKSPKTPIQYIAGIARVMAQLRGWIGPGDSEDTATSGTVKLDELVRAWAAESTPDAPQSPQLNDPPVDNSTIAKW